MSDPSVPPQPATSPSATSPSGDQPDAMRLSRRYVTRLSAAVALIVLTCVALLVPVPYVTMKPGPAFDTLGDFDGTPMFTFGKGVKTYPTDGTLDFTTVSVTNSQARLRFGDVVRAYFSDDVAVVPRSLLYPEGTTQEQSQAESAAQLDSSKDASKVAALRAAGYTVDGVPQVATVSPDGAAKGVLRKGDLVLAVDGTKVASASATVEAVGDREPGDDVAITIERKGKRSTVDITTRPDAADPSLPRIGVGLGTKYDYPISIDNNVGRQIGGPSAGTMFALAIYDKLTPGALTGGLKIAGTGEITAEGVVGPIGGVQQKIAGAHAVGAKIFLVPKANCAEAVDGDTHGLKLVEITTLKDAISSVKALAEDRSAKVPTCR